MSDAHAQTDNTVLPENRVLDALIIGAGMSGIDELNRLLFNGYDAIAVDAASGVGGTWYWNRYPGARVDSESYSYGYFFSKEIQAEWDWTEHFSGQPENEQYFNFVVDTLDLRPHIKLDTKVESAHFDDAEDIWEVLTSTGDTCRTRFLITAIGILSDPRYPAVPGRGRFTGQSMHTARWPKEEVELDGKRVAVIGTGSSGVQVISAIGPIVGSLTVFQHSANWCLPLNNEPLTPLEMAEIKGKYDLIWQSTQTVGGFVHRPIKASAWDFTPEERREWYETLYARRGFARFYSNFPELILSQELNNEYSAFLANKIKERVNDPAVAERLIPDDHGYGQKRPPYETNYYEVYNQPNVELVDCRENPMVEITERGIRTAQQEYEFDVIIYATGFNAITGAFERIDIKGADNVDLKESWKHGPQTFAGIGVPGFPNLLVLGGPQALGGNNPRCIEKQTPFIAKLIEHMSAEGYTRVDVGPGATQKWADHVGQLVEATLYADHNSWFWAKKDGDDRVFGLYAPGVVKYGKQLSAIEANGYEEFEFS